MTVADCRKNILILDPERDTAELFSRALEHHCAGYKCYWVSDTQMAMSLISEIPFSFILADVSLLQQGNFLLLEWIRESDSGTVVIANAYLKEKHSILKAMQLGAAGYFTKPVMVSSLRMLIDDFINAEDA